MPRVPEPAAAVHETIRPHRPQGPERDGRHGMGRTVDIRCYKRHPRSPPNDGTALPPTHGEGEAVHRNGDLAVARPAPEIDHTNRPALG